MSPLPSHRDVVRAYQLFLGREPESHAVVEEMIRHASETWLVGFIVSDEFRANVRDRLISGAGLVSAGHLISPAPALTNWAAEALPLTETARAEIRRSDGWAEVFCLVLTDPIFTAAVLGAQPLDEEFLAALQRTDQAKPLAVSAATIDAVRLDMIEGWVDHASDNAGCVFVELWIDDIFTSAGAANIARRDLQERIGGTAQVGFRLSYRTADLRRNEARAEVREASTGKVLASTLVLRRSLLPQDAVALLRQELLNVRATLSKIEATLPDLHQALSYPLEAYDAYHRANIGHKAADTVADVGLTIILDTTALPVSLVARWCESLSHQSEQPEQIIVVHDRHTAKLEIEAAAARSRREDRALTLVTAQDGGWAAAMTEAVSLARGETLIFSRADGVLAPDACRCLANAVAGGGELVFADDDQVALSPDGAVLFNHDPILRTAFDLDLLLAGDSIGTLVATKKALIERLGFRHDRGEARFYDLFLRASEVLDPGAIRHLSRVLWHRVGPREQIPVRARMIALEDHLARTGVDAIVERHEDSLGATVENATRVRRRLQEPVRVAVVIPTRDRLDLLGPCLASIAASSVRSRATIETIIVDNQSEAGATKAFLAAASGLGAVRVMEHDGPFNWALVNNRAAASVQADVIVFLNNDTVALDDQCWDELCVQAMRPEVGAVGARLLYDDGTIQHAGVITGDWHGFARHEGVGQPGSTCGYLGRHSLTRQVASVTGACLVTRAEVFAAIGGFDVGLPVEGSDTDYCLKLRDAGYRIIYHPPATLYHFESKSRGYNLDEVKKQRGAAATAILRERWDRAYGDDPFYNGHFDRLSDPCTRLRLIGATDRASCS